MSSLLPYIGDWFYLTKFIGPPQSPPSQTHAFIQIYIHTGRYSVLFFYCRLSIIYVHVCIAFLSIFIHPPLLPPPPRLCSQCNSIHILRNLFIFFSKK